MIAIQREVKEKKDDNFEREKGCKEANMEGKRKNEKGCREIM